MKKFLIIALALFLPTTALAALRDDLSGRILLQVQENGEAYYIYPENKEKYYLGRPADAFQIMRQLGLGIRHDELENYLSSRFPARLSGMIMLDVEANGEAYYVDPLDRNGYYLGRPADAFRLMREKGLGITNQNLEQIPLAGLNPIPNNPQNGTKEPQNGNQDETPSDLALKAFSLVNAHRASIGVPTLTWNEQIASEARMHSQNMADGLIVPSHAGFEQRVDNISAKLGSYAEAAENLAWNNFQDPAQEALDSWLESPEHKQALEDPDYDITGIGVDVSDENIYYFTQIFFDVN